jgi:hypothetical protein
MIHSLTPAGDRTVRLGVPLLDEYLEFVAARCRPNMLNATTSLRVISLGGLGTTPKNTFKSNATANKVRRLRRVMPQSPIRIGVVTVTDSQIPPG